MTTQVKICGVRTMAAAEAVRACGADFAGLNFVPTSKRHVDVGKAATLARALRPVRVVGVFADQTAEEIVRVAAAVELDYVQLHGNESIALGQKLAQRFRLIKAFRFDAIDPAWASIAELFLIDGPTPGSGRGFDWARIDLEKPYLLAGGLTPENVGVAIAQKAPRGVDVASGIEVEGVQDAERIRAFVSEARKR